MVIGATTDLIRIMGTLLRRADSGLASHAARNAATSMNAHQFRELDDARTLRDLESIPPANLDIAAAQSVEALPR
jgi:hypothetical protein